MPSWKSAIPTSQRRHGCLEMAALMHAGSGETLHTRSSSFRRTILMKISMENIDEEWLRTVALNMCWICAEQLHGAVALGDGAGELS